MPASTAVPCGSRVYALRIGPAATALALVAGALLLGSSAPAQMTGARLHPHVAEVAPESARGGLRPFLPASGLWTGASPMFNLPDGIWNNGEGFHRDAQSGLYLPDFGGWRGLDEGDEISLENVFQYGVPSVSGPVWQDYQATEAGITVRRFVGYLRDAELAPGQRVDDAAFQILTTKPYRPSWGTVIVIDTAGTLANGTAPWDPYAYVGFVHDDGWGPAGKQGPNVMARAMLAPNPYNVVWASIKPRTFGRPAILQMQRNLQLLRVVELMLAKPDGPEAVWRPDQDWPSLSDLPVLIAGASFGGWTAQLAVMLYPERFHGAFPRAIGASMQRTVGEQEFWTWQNARCGFPASGTAFTGLDTLRWAGFLKQKGAALGVDLRFVDVSLTRRFRSGQLHRPVFFQVGDEDVTGTGATWIPLLHGSRDYVESGTAVNPAVGPGGQAYVHADVFWAVLDKRNHEGGYHTLPFSFLPAALQRTKHHEDGLVAMLHQTALAAAHDPAPPPFVPVATGANGVDATEDPHDHVHGEGRWTPSTPSGPLANRLAPDPTFASGVPAPVRRPGKSHGHGTWLGYDDSLIATDAGDIFVGGAEGIVTRFRVDAATQELEAVDMSPALGHGAWALALGDVVSNGAGVEELVVATYRHLFVLDPADLGAGPEMEQMLPFAYSRPRRLQVADVFPQLGGDEILFQTHMGHLAVYRVGAGTLTEVVNYPEAGVQDLVVHPGIDYQSPHGEATSHAITLLSHRGHVANISLDDQNRADVDERAQLYAWTGLLTGLPLDLEAFDHQGQRKIAALFTTTEVAEHTIRTFDARTMAASSTRDTKVDADVVVDAAPLDGPKLDFEITTRAQQPYFVVLGHNRLHLVDRNGVRLGLKDLTSFAPAVNALDVAVADIVPNPGGFFDDEVILSTQAGQVVWLPMDELMTPGLEISSSRFSTPFRHTHPALVATWGMAARNGQLEVVDQTGTRWSIDPAQAPASVWFRHELRPTVQWGGVGLELGLQAGPIRDMAWFGHLGPVATSPFWQYLAGSNPGTANAGGAQLRPWQPQRHRVAGWLFSNTSDWVQEPHFAMNYDGFFVFPRGGAAIAGEDAYWWGGQEAISFANLLQGLRAEGAGVASGAWSTTGQARPPTPDDILDLRTPFARVSGSDLGTVRVVEDPTANGEPLVIAGTPGGSVMLLRADFAGGTGELTWENPDRDFGHGGCALAARRYPETQPDSVQVFFGPVFHHPDPMRHVLAGVAGPNASERIVSSIHAFRWDGSQLNATGTWILEAGGALPVGDSGGYGLCGLHLGDLFPSSPGPELVATTLNGDLFVFGTDGDGITQLLHRTQVEGSLGAFNSILVADLDQVAGNELYVAGSLGLRKFVYVP